MVFPVGFVGGSAVLAGVWLAVPGAASQSLGPAHEPGLVWLGLDGGLRQLGLGLTPSNIKDLYFCDNKKVPVFLHSVQTKVNKNGKTQQTIRSPTN